MARHAKRRRRRASTIHDPCYAAMIADLRKRRIHRGLSQYQAAVKVGQTRHWLGKIERCDLRLDVLQFVRLCRAVGVSSGRMLRHLAKKKSSAMGDFFFSCRGMGVWQSCGTRKLRCENRAGQVLESCRPR